MRAPVPGPGYLVESGHYGQGRGQGGPLPGPDGLQQEGGLHYQHTSLHVTFPRQSLVCQAYSITRPGDSA